MRAFAPGIYARSEALVQATRDLDRGRTAPDEVAEQLRRDRAELLSVQEEAGFDLLADGLLDWQDLFRPLAEATEGLAARPLVRFLDTNTFYRAVLVEGEPRLRAPVRAPDLPAGRWVATLPSPTAFARAADGAVAAGTLAEHVLAPQIEAYAGAGCALVVLNDPFLLSDGYADDLVSALAQLPESVPLALWLPFGDASSVLARLADAPVAGIGVDFYATPLEAVPAGYPKQILAGVVDTRSSRVESAQELAAFAEQLLQREPAGLSLIPNGDFQFVSEPIARQKLAALGSAKAPLEEAA